MENWRLFFTEAQMRRVQGRSGIQSLQEDKHKEDWTNGQEVLLEHGECDLWAGCLIGVRRVMKGR